MMKIKQTLLLLAAVGTIGTTLVGCASNDSNSSSSSSQSTKQSSESSSEEKTDQDTLNSLSSAKLSEFNSGLDSNLAEDQSEYDQGTKDYAWSKLVTKIHYNKTTGLTIWVPDSFSTLTKSEREVVGNGAQKLAKMQMTMMDLDTTPDSDLLYLNVHDAANDRVGHSSAWDTSSFKWTDIK